MPSIDQERLQRHGPEEPVAGRYVLYWMSSAVRTQDNAALEFAIERANASNRRLAVLFVIDPSYPEAQQRHFEFLRQGIHDVATGLARRNVKFVVRIGARVDQVLDVAADATEIVTDRTYLRHQRNALQPIIDLSGKPVTEVEGAVIVPTHVVSDKREYAARTIRPKIHRHLETFLELPDTVTLDKKSRNLSIAGATEAEIDELIAGLDDGDTVQTSTRLFTGGQFQARTTLDRFIGKQLSTYVDERSRPEAGNVSHMSMYLHFGHISPIRVATEIRASDAPEGTIDSFIEELVVRRELGFNYVEFEPAYDKYSSLPEWARKTLAEHRDDPREHVYARSEFELAQTHDPYWNAAMIQLRETGYLHNYMRMYWGKKILEWSNTPEYAYRTVLTLNNRHLYDGRDPNSYGNIGWVFGLWDRAWQERDVFGKTRSMTASGLERKADPDAYVSRISEITGLEVGG
jgi:deoxyribodipyrimidine photo-lyase